MHLFLLASFIGLALDFLTVDAGLVLNIAMTMTEPELFWTLQNNNLNEGRPGTAIQLGRRDSSSPSSCVGMDYAGHLVGALVKGACLLQSSQRTSILETFTPISFGPGNIVRVQLEADDQLILLHHEYGSQMARDCWETLYGEPILGLDTLRDRLEQEKTFSSSFCYKTSMLIFSVIALDGSLNSLSDQRPVGISNTTPSPNAQPSVDVSPPLQISNRFDPNNPSDLVGSKVLSSPLMTKTPPRQNYVVNFPSNEEKSFISDSSSIEHFDKFEPEQPSLAALSTYFSRNPPLRWFFRAALLSEGITIQKNGDFPLPNAVNVLFAYNMVMCVRGRETFRKTFKHFGYEIKNSQIRFSDQLKKEKIKPKQENALTISFDDERGLITSVLKGQCPLVAALCRATEKTMLTITRPWHPVEQSYNPGDLLLICTVELLFTVANVLESQNFSIKGDFLAFSKTVFAQMSRDAFQPIHSPLLILELN